jgi:hypothetical protein
VNTAVAFSRASNTYVTCPPGLLRVLQRRALDQRKASAQGAKQRSTRGNGHQEFSFELQTVLVLQGIGARDLVAEARTTDTYAAPGGHT